LLDARGVVSPTQRQEYIKRVRDLAKGCAQAHVANETAITQEIIRAGSDRAWQ